MTQNGHVMTHTETNSTIYFIDVLLNSTKCSIDIITYPVPTALPEGFTSSITFPSVAKIHELNSLLVWMIYLVTRKVSPRMPCCWLPLSLRSLHSAGHRIGVCQRAVNCVRGKPQQHLYSGGLHFNTKPFPASSSPRLRETYYITRCCCSWPLLLLPVVQGVSRTPTTAALDAMAEVSSQVNT
jgi:hypothetical protein